MTREGGRIVLLGHHTESCTLLPYQLTGKDLLGANVRYDYSTQLFLDGMERIRQGKLPVQEIISHKAPFPEAPAIYEMLINNPEGAAAILLDWETGG
jgi:threonine dehydrogenase-like Zn-dependent dehydrogenase